MGRNDGIRDGSFVGAKEGETDGGCVLCGGIVGTLDGVLVDGLIDSLTLGAILGIIDE